MESAFSSGGDKDRMPSGDAQRVWFPEMLADLTAAWSPSTTWEDLADLCSHLTERRQALRQSRGIEAPLTRCPKCGRASRSDISGVSIRSALFALKKIGVLIETDFKRLDAEWKQYRATHGLDAYGRRAVASASAAQGDEPTCC
jgi:hypothetical protein